MRYVVVSGRSFSAFSIFNSAFSIHTRLPSCVTICPIGTNGVLPDDAGQVSAGQINAGQIGSIEIDTSQHCPTKIGAGQIGVTQINPR